ncbi:MAG TPA: hypothetical protein VD790_00575 [Thermoleophilaceae bacterium]|nr:hypothetical protein [Thermoleophilaceae bacterium]
MRMLTLPLATVIGGTRGAVDAARGAARHLAWYLSHHARGSGR